MISDRKSQIKGNTKPIVQVDYKTVPKVQLEVLSLKEPTFIDLKDEIQKYVYPRMYAGEYNIYGALLASHLHECSLTNDGNVSFSFIVPDKNGGIVTIICKTDAIYTPSLAMPEICSTVLNKLFSMESPIIKQEIVGTNANSMSKYANAPTFVPNPSGIYPKIPENIFKDVTVAKKKKKKKGKDTAKRKKDEEENDQEDQNPPPYEHINDEMNELSLSETDSAGVESEDSSLEEDIPINSKTRKSRSLVASSDKIVPTTNSRPRSLSRSAAQRKAANEKKSSSTQMMIKSPIGKTTMGAKGTDKQMNIPKSIKLSRKQNIDSGESNYSDKNEYKEICNKTIKKNKYNGDYMLNEKRMISRNGDNSGNRRNSIINNSLLSTNSMGKNTTNYDSYEDY